MADCKIRTLDLDFQHTLRTECVHHWRRQCHFNPFLLKKTIWFHEKKKLWSKFVQTGLSDEFQEVLDVPKTCGQKRVYEIPWGASVHTSNETARCEDNRHIGKCGIFYGPKKMRLYLVFPPYFDQWECSVLTASFLLVKIRKKY